MSPRKLTDDDKQEILKLYRQTEETTSTLADRYGVSSSTISRFLKNHLTNAEYEDLIQQKRLARTSKPTLSLDLPLLTTELPIEPEPASPPLTEEANLPTQETQEWEIAPLEPKQVLKTEEIAPASSGSVIAIEEILGEDIVPLDELDDDDDFEEDWDDEEVETDYSQSFSTTINVKVLPLSAAAFPKTCYLVIDRAAELIARPLKEFGDLGKIPAEEFQQKTLPIFDNHRVARRFSNRSQRVIKVPDGRMLHKTRAYLKAKGITRLLIDGQIYSLSSI
jgi:transposase-like protein